MAQKRGANHSVCGKYVGVSIPTLIRMERGDPGVGAGIYVTALWLIGTSNALPDLAAPEADRGALEKGYPHGYHETSRAIRGFSASLDGTRSEEHTSELQSLV